MSFPQSTFFVPRIASVFEAFRSRLHQTSYESTQAVEDYLKLTSRTRSSQSSVNKLLLKLSNLSLESLNLLPTIQRSAIIHPQTLHKTFLGLFNSRVGLFELLAALELAAQLGDFFGYAVVATVLVLR